MQYVQMLNAGCFGQADHMRKVKLPLAPLLKLPILCKCNMRELMRDIIVRQGNAKVKSWCETQGNRGL